MFLIQIKNYNLKNCKIKIKLMKLNNKKKLLNNYRNKKKSINKKNINML